MIFRSTSTLSDRWFDFTWPVDLIVAMILYLVLGFLFDRFQRIRLLSLSGFLWGVSVWLMSFAPTFATFNLSKATSGVGYASHSGIFATVGDFFKPTNRGKILGLLLLAQPLGLLFALALPESFITAYWRFILFVLGAISFILTILIQLFIREPRRGATEPALRDINITGTYQFDWDITRDALKQLSLIRMYVIVFLSTLPWMILPAGILGYLVEFPDLQSQVLNFIWLPTIVGIALGFPLGGNLGDYLFRYHKNGRLFSALLGLVIPPICLYTSLNILDVKGQGFSICILLMGFFMAFTLPNLFASFMDIVLPELRASAFGVALLFQTVSMLISPSLYSFFQSTLGRVNALLWICIGAWVICTVVLIRLFSSIPKDIENYRRHMAYRAHLEARLQRPQAG